MTSGEVSRAVEKNAAAEREGLDGTSSDTSYWSVLMRTRALFMAGLLMLTGGALALPRMAAAAGIKKLTDVPLNKYFPFAGMNVRVDKIETVAHADGRKILESVSGGFDHDKGYIMVTVTFQNPSDSESIDMPSTWIGFELADGSQIEEASPAGPFLTARYTVAPNSLHPKQHAQVVYVITDWNGQAPTKMFLFVNGGTAANDTGYQHVRLQLPKDYVQVLPPQ
jgi:hypothetical protein